jgi:hypothetical protein
MSVTIIKESIANQSELTVATTSILHNVPLGHKIRVWDDTKEMEKEYIYLQISTGQGTRYLPYVVNYTYTTGLEVNTLTPVFTTTGLGMQGALVELCVLPMTCTSGTYAWAQTKGACTVATAATTSTFTVGKTVGVISAAVAVSLSTAQVAAVQPNNQFGVVTTTQTSGATTVAVNLFGRLALVTS